MRLWPLSRRNRPKQILRMIGDSSLLRQSFERISSLFRPEQIHIITNQQHIEAVQRECPEVPRDNLYGEPVGRDTANAVGLATAIIHNRDPNATVGIFTADHVITPLDRFSAAVEQAYSTAEREADALITLGVRPTRADTNYGYIHRGKALGDGVYEVSEFTEKPSLAAATKYIGSGEYYWNSGMFVWRTTTILDQLRKHLPQSQAALGEIAAAWSTRDRDQTLQRIYPTLLRISIDFAVMERADRVLVVEMSCRWVDVGSWTAIESVIPADGDGNVRAAEQVMHLGSRGNIVISEEKHLIATIGVDDLVIVHSPDATLICTRRDATSIKELVENIRQEYGDEYI